MEPLRAGPAGPPAHPARLPAIAAAIASISAVGIGLSLTVPLLSLEMERMGVSGAVIGANTAVAGIAGIAVVPFVPRVAARIGVVRLLWLAVVAGAAALLLFKALFGIAWWFPLRFVLAAALATLFVLSEYWINAAAPPERRGLVMGIYATILALGFAAGPAVLTFVGTSGWPPYLAGAGLFALATLPLALARGLSPVIDQGSGRSILSLVAAAPIATMAAVVFGAVETGGFALLPVYGLHLGLDPEGAAFLVSVVALGNVLFQIPVGLLSDKVDRRMLLMAVAAAGAIGAALVPAASGNEAALLTLLFVWGGVSGALYTVGLAHLGSRFAATDLASANATFVVLYNVGLLAGPPVIGGSMDLFPPHGFALSLAMLFAAYLALASGVLLVRSRRRHGPALSRPP